MQVQGLVWLGTRTPAYAATRRFFASTLELPVGNERPHFVRFDLPDGGVIEVFDAADDPYAHFSTGPVLGFQVADFDRARDELAARGHPLLPGAGGERGDYRWQHFRGFDGLVFEVVDYPHRPAPTAPAGPLRITSLVWMGVSTPDLNAAARFYRETLGLPVVEETADLVECRMPDGSSVEAFRRGSEMDHPHFRTGPVPGLGVGSIDDAMATLRARGVSLLLTRRREWGGWAHFRAPDGNVYELKETARTHRG